MFAHINRPPPVNDFRLDGIAGPYPQQYLGIAQGKRCIVVASGHCVWDDLDRLGVHGDQNNGWETICVNDMMQYYPGVVNHGFTNQYRWLPHWVGGRRETINGFKVVDKWGRIGLTHSMSNAQVNWPWPGHGTSALGAVYTALALGYDKIVLCGVPLDNSHHFFEPPWCTSNFDNEVGVDPAGKMRYWKDSMRKWFGGRVFAMSGRTRDLLGEP